MGRGPSKQVLEICKHCGKQFTSKHSRYVHEIRHTGVFLYNCNHCNKGFNEKSVMQKHKVKRHGDSYTNPCEKCGKGFMTEGALYTHISICGIIEPKIRKKNISLHPCHLCSKTFNRNCNLERHIKVHKGVKEFSCDWCGKEFRDPRSLKTHTAKKHGFP